MRRLLSTCLLAASVSGGLLAVSPGTALADDACPGVAVGGTSVGVCEYFVVSPTSNTGYTVEGTARPYCTSTIVVCPGTTLRWYLNDTGADVNGSTPPVPTYDPGTGQVSAPAGTYATVYVNGTAYPVNTPPYCVTTDVRCP